MAFKFVRGTVVRQILPAAIVGTVVDYELDRGTGEVLAKVEWKTKDSKGVEHTQSRFFPERDLIAVPSVD